MTYPESYPLTTPPDVGGRVDITLTAKALMLAINEGPDFAWSSHLDMHRVGLWDVAGERFLGTYVDVVYLPMGAGPARVPSLRRIRRSEYRGLWTWTPAWAHPVMFFSAANGVDVVAKARVWPRPEEAGLP